jgi:hypothetical protein
MPPVKAQERPAETADLSTALRFGRDEKGERRPFQGQSLLNRSFFATTVDEGTVLPFVISTEA